MIINYDVEKIRRALEDFYNATGIDMDLLRPDFTSACHHALKNVSYCRAAQSTELGRCACEHSDAELLEKCKKSRRTEISLCHAGLLNIAVPLFYEDNIIGYLILGRMKPDTDFIPDKEYMSGLGLDFDKMREFYSDLPVFNSERVESVSNIAIMLAKYVLLKNMLKPSFNERMRHILTFIDAHLSDELSVKVISEGTNVSKSALYNLFHDNFSCTVSEYVNMRRVEKSLELLLSTDKSVEQISYEVGFSSAAYYSRIFKRKMGISPIKYRIKHAR